MKALWYRRASMARISKKPRAIEIHPDADLKDFRVTVSAEVDEFVRRMEFRFRVSKSAVIETALLNLMQHEDEKVGAILKSAGAGLRRR